ncbi:hypothetical protein [Halobacterium bonnevillei]|uniref:Uncharacterized protein n=1 Tax=Halobacterium bonnevillei TaxID=2692200 RepID=A0A6B0SKR4_9EURY|nr:hypothetical protein [Halobacterium bonnevillei]MXR21807.1 hypothetical protein [Halobacterium bonnevillei]
MGEHDELRFTAEGAGVGFAIGAAAFLALHRASTDVPLALGVGLGAGLSLALVVSAAQTDD